MHVIGKPQRYILTGMPGCGKTTTLNVLIQKGYQCVREAATDVIIDAQGKGHPRPWEDSDFVDTIIRVQRSRQLKSQGCLQFYDRSPFCTYALARYLAHHQKRPFEPSSLLQEEVERCLREGIYHPSVFFFEDLGFIDTTDVRTISYEEALFFEQFHKDVYLKFGFEIVMIPKDTPESRATFILDSVVTR